MSTRVLSLVVTLGASFALLMGTASAVPAPVIGPVQGDALHVMSYNLRFASRGMPNSWTVRRPVMAELLIREGPAILGTQEGMYGQLQDIEHDLPSYYDWIGVGREGGTRGEFMAIFYDTRRLRLQESGHFWLSDTPDVAGSASWGNDVPRMATWARFADLRTGKKFLTLNTHFDNKSEKSSRRSAELVRTMIQRLAGALPVVVTGDFNDWAGNSPGYDILVTQGGLKDSWLAAGQRLTPLYATYHGYRRIRLNGNRIDWILTKGPVTTTAAAINTFSRNGQFPSDHFPIHVLVALG